MKCKVLFVLIGVFQISSLVAMHEQENATKALAKHEVFIGIKGEDPARAIKFPTALLEGIGLASVAQEFSPRQHPQASETLIRLHARPENKYVDLSKSVILQILTLLAQASEGRKMAIPTESAHVLLHTADYLMCDASLMKSLSRKCINSLDKNDHIGQSIIDRSIISPRSLLMRGSLSMTDPDRYMPDQATLNLTGLKLHNLVGLKNLASLIGPVKTLNLCENKIRRISPEMIETIMDAFPELKVLDLSQNGIRHIDAHSFDVLPDTFKLYLRKNPLLTIEQPCGYPLANGIIDIWGGREYGRTTIHSLCAVFLKKKIINPPQYFGYSAVCCRCERVKIDQIPLQDVYMTSCCRELTCKNCAISTLENNGLFLAGIDRRQIVNCSKCDKRNLEFIKFENIYWFN